MKKVWPIIVLGLLVLTGCMGDNSDYQPKTQEEAEKTAEAFARAWERSDYSSMYDFFTPRLKELRNKEDFIKFALAYNTKDTSPIVRLDKVSMEEDVAYVYYTLSSGLFESKAPAMQLEYVGSRWFVNAFVIYFTETCIEECFERNCNKVTCSSETGFKCEYKKIDPCECFNDFDCPYDKPLCMQNTCQSKQCGIGLNCEELIPLDLKYDCESKGLRFYIHSWCEGGKCKFSCYEAEYDPDDKLKLNVKIINVGNTYFEISNYDEELTNIIIIINGEYKKEFDRIGSSAKLKVDRSEFLRESQYFPEMSEDIKVESIYFYSEQGKWWN